MITVELSDIYKSVPIIASPGGYYVALTDSNGNQRKVFSTQFAQTVKTRIYPGKAYRIKNIASVLISARGTIGTRSALLWVSSYGSGQNTRTLCRKIYSATSYRWYVNGGSEEACLYVTIESDQNDYLAVTSLYGNTPIIEEVASLPTDADTLESPS